MGVRGRDFNSILLVFTLSFCLPRRWMPSPSLHPAYAPAIVSEWPSIPAGTFPDRPSACSYQARAASLVDIFVDYDFDVDVDIVVDVGADIDCCSYLFAVLVLLLIRMRVLILVLIRMRVLILIRMRVLILVRMRGVLRVSTPPMSLHARRSAPGTCSWPPGRACAG